MSKTIYVVGGTNGVGKSTIRESLLNSSIPYINADFIAKNLATKHSSLMLAELARQYGSEQMKKYIAEGKSFAFENNLHEENTYKWLERMQKSGYDVQLFYVGVENLKITTQRIQERVKRGEHYVPPDEVYARYVNGLKLLRRYFHLPDQLIIIDNTTFRFGCLMAEHGFITIEYEETPKWVTDFVNSLEAAPAAQQARNLNSIDEVRALYKKPSNN